MKKVTPDNKRFLWTVKPELLDKLKFNETIFLVSGELITPKNGEKTVITKCIFLNDHQ